MNKGLSVSLVLVLSFATGVAVFSSNFTEQTKDRNPAAISGKVFQISSLSSDEIKSQLQKKMKVTPTIEGQKTITFNCFSSALCKTYKTIEVELVAEGVSVGGAPPQMKISYPCEAGQDPAELAAIQLPVGRILGEKPRSAEFKFEGYNGVVTLTNSADEWPRQWVIQGVEFKAAEGENKRVNFNRGPASVETEKPIVLEF